MTIEFNDGGNSDVAILKKSSLQEGALPSFADCVLFGSLRDEKDASIAVNGCPGNNTFKASIHPIRELKSGLLLISPLVKCRCIEVLALKILCIRLY